EIGKVAISAPITGPERSAMTEADTTNAAVIAMRTPSVRMKMSSGENSILVMAGHSRSKNGVAYARLRRPSTSSCVSMMIKDVDARDKPGHDDNKESKALHRDRNLRAVLDGLVDHAIALGEFLEQIELVLRRVGLHFKGQAASLNTNDTF